MPDIVIDPQNMLSPCSHLLLSNQDTDVDISCIVCNLDKASSRIHGIKLLAAFLVAEKFILLKCTKLYWNSSWRVLERISYAPE